ncbi:MAG: alpha-galactosidase [Planctomycetota bacterium]
MPAVTMRRVLPLIHATGFAATLALTATAQDALRQQTAVLPPLPAAHPDADWLLDPRPFTAGVHRGAHAAEIALDNGLLRRTFRLTPNGATVALDEVPTGRALLRAVKPEAIVELGGHRFAVGGLIGQPNHAYLLPEWRDALEADPAAMRLVDFTSGPANERLPWQRVRHCAPDAQWPPAGVHLAMRYAMPDSAPAPVRDITVTVHYELYDGVPVFSKWLEIHNATTAMITVDRFTSELLAAVEHGSNVETRAGAPTEPPAIHVETDYAFAAMTPRTANRFAVHWVPDPNYATQVNYQRQTPCLLEVRPEVGPSQDVAPGATFTTFRTFVLPYDGTDRERQGLALRRMYRVIAPWVTENPLMMHVRHADPDTVRAAIDQCAAVGFEMVILTFGSGFNIENEAPEYLAQMAELAGYAKDQGIELGGYSLLSSRRIGDGNDVVPPEGVTPTHGHCPALASPWGQRYFDTLYRFFGASGFSLLEHDGSYPGDLDTTARPPLQKGLDDSRWVQWRIITDFYRWCRGQGVYLNVPDYYYLSGSNKCGMGYRETNWSLPRDQQVLHTRQNIYDGTWQKTPSMGWMFVPLTEYHGGGAAATIEPLEEHLDHYERMLSSNLALGVQACYRGPRLFDSDATKRAVQRWVAWFREHRDILESDLIHGRRADGRDLDWMLHVNPALPTKGMLCVFNPLPRAVTKSLRVPLYYTGLTETARLRDANGRERTVALDRGFRATVPVTVPARGMAWYTVH